MQPLVLGLDIGGANLKAATSRGDARSLAFPLWKQPEKLAAAVRELVARCSDAECIAVTMTGELADCYATKADGVRQILNAVASVAEHRQIHVWGVDGRFHAIESAVHHPLTVAASNWHGLASWVAQRYLQESGLLIDLGSTTTDIILFVGGQPTAIGRTDLTRLQAGELVYTGTRRTPLCAVVSQVPYQGQLVPVAAELFATTLDVYLRLGLVPEDPTDLDTADGRPATRDAAGNRLCHMLCCDSAELNADEIQTLAEFCLEQQLQGLENAVRRVINRQPGQLDRLVLSGSGVFLGEILLDRMPECADLTTTSLARELTPELASAACAYAVACLLAETSAR